MDNGVTQKGQRLRFRLYNLFSFGLPAILTLSTLIIHLVISNTVPASGNSTLSQLPAANRRSLIAPGIGSDTCFLAGYLAKVKLVI